MVEPVEVGSAANTYEIVGKLAEGGMAEIFLARAAGAGGVERYVVLKRIIREVANDAELVKMFLDEARLAAQLQHPNVVQVFDVGRLGSSYFFTMEYVHGETLRTLIKQARKSAVPLPIACVLAIAAGAAAGLHHAHSRKSSTGVPLEIVHRDISPSNLMLTHEGHVKVVDFGVAKWAHRQRKTQQGMLVGKLAYMSPEQCLSKPLDRRSDLFSLGIVIWECLTSTRLFHRDSDFLTISAVIEDDIPSPLRIRADIPREVEALVMRLLSRQPAARFQSARDLVDEIERISEQHNLSPTPSRLARMMRERFGERVEPWLEPVVQKNPTHITVRSEPIPSDLSTPNGSEDERLRDAPSLSPPRGNDEEHEALPTVLDMAAPVMTELDLVPVIPTTASPTPPTQPARVASKLPTPVTKPVRVASKLPTKRGMGDGTDKASALDAPDQRSRTPFWIVGAMVVAVVAVIVIMRPWESQPRPSEPAVEPAHLPVNDAAAAVAVTIDAGLDAAVATVDATVDSIAEAFAVSRFPDVVAGCVGGDLDSHRATCVEAACRVNDRKRAVQWFAKLAKADRPAMIATCRGAGIDLAPRRDPCELDPMACQK